MNSEEIREQFNSLLTKAYNESRNNNYISEFVYNNIPDKLFRFRSFTTYNIEALKNDQIFLVSPTLMNDLWDSTCYINKNTIEKFNVDNQTLSEYMISLELDPNNFDKKSEELCKLFGLSENGFKQCLTEFNNDSLIKDVLWRIMWNTIEPIYNKYLDSINTNTINALQPLRKIACFSENIKSNKMWGLYSDSHKGFALEYNFKKDNLKCSKCNHTCLNMYMDYPIFPIIYGKVFDASDYINLLFLLELSEKYNKKPLLPTFNPISLISAFLYKDMEWAEEKEWRLLSKLGCVEENDESEITSITYKPSAIYCGAKISIENFNLLKDISLQKKIPLYIMYNDNKQMEYTCVET